MNSYVFVLNVFLYMIRFFSCIMISTKFPPLPCGCPLKGSGNASTYLLEVDFVLVSISLSYYLLLNHKKNLLT